MSEPEAILINGEIRCPICNKKHGEITGNEIVKNYRTYCRGGVGTGKHYFIINLPKESEEEKV